MQCCDIEDAGHDDRRDGKHEYDGKVVSGNSRDESGQPSWLIK